MVPASSLGAICQWAGSFIPEKAKKAAGSPIGKIVIGVAGNSIGMTLGSSYPAFASAMGAAYVNRGNSRLGVAAALTTYALCTALSYATTGGESGLATACSFLLISAGSIAGGFVGTNVCGGNERTPNGIFEARKAEVRERFREELEQYTNVVAEAIVGVEMLTADGKKTLERECLRCISEFEGESQKIDAKYCHKMLTLEKEIAKFGEMPKCNDWSEEEKIQEQKEAFCQKLQELQDAYQEELGQLALRQKQKLQGLEDAQERAIQELQRSKIEAEGRFLEVEDKMNEECSAVSLFSAYIDSYPIRTFNYLVVAGLIQHLPITLIAQVGLGGLAAYKLKEKGGEEVGPITMAGAALMAASVTQMAVPALLPFAGYYAQDLPGLAQFSQEMRASYVEYHSTPHGIGFADPGNITKKLFSEKAHETNDSLQATFIGKLLPLLIGKDAIVRAVDEKIATTAAARALNEYLNIIQSDRAKEATESFVQGLKLIEEEEKELNAEIQIFEKTFNVGTEKEKELLKPRKIELEERGKAISAKRQTLETGFRNCIYLCLGLSLGREIMVKVAAVPLQNTINGLVDKVMAEVEAKEKKTGMRLSDTKTNGAILKAHLFSYCVFAALNIKDTLNAEHVDELTEEEIGRFYQQLTALFFSQYNSSMIRGFGNILHDVLPSIIDKAGFYLAPLLSAAPVTEEDFVVVEEAIEISDELEEGFVVMEREQIEPTFAAAPQTEISHETVQVEAPTVRPSRQVSEQTAFALLFFKVLMEIGQFFVFMGESISNVFKKKEPVDPEIEKLLGQYKEIRKNFEELSKHLN